MVPNSESTEIAKIMSASIAPVFMITGIAAVLSIMALRYGRVIDRIRSLLRDGPKLYKKDLGHDHLVRELRSLYTRAKLLRIIIILEVVSIFFISITIFTLFLSLSFGVYLPYVPQIFFIISLFFLMVGLILFIQDFAMSLACIEHDMNVRWNPDRSDNRQDSKH